MSGRVVTLVYDPEGEALSRFQQCAKSVLRQSSQDFSWVVSIQHGTHASTCDYIQSLMHDRLEIRRSRAETLGHHLAEVLALESSAQWTHLLCQDDSYASLDSISELQRHLTSFDALVLSPSPARHRRQQSIHVTQVSPLERALACSGVNRLGGLSIFAWQGSGIRADARFSMLADLAMFRTIQLSGRKIRKVSGLLDEGRWSGQAQFHLRDTWEVEAMNFVSSFQLRGWRAAIAAALSQIYGFPELAKAWTTVAPGYTFVLRQVVRPISRFRSSMQKMRETHLLGS